MSSARAGPATRAFAADNHNWALRLAGKDGSCRISFLFRDADNRKGKQDDWHRWTSDAGFAAGGGWHHVAVSYTFGQGDSVRGYVDGREIEGHLGLRRQDRTRHRWSMTIKSGSARPSANNAGNSFVGGIDEVAIYRTALSAERIAARWKVDPAASRMSRTCRFPTDAVLVEVLEGLPDDWNWDFIPPKPSERFTQPDLAFVEVPKKYNAHGVHRRPQQPVRLVGSCGGRTAGRQAAAAAPLAQCRPAVHRRQAGGRESRFPRGKTDGHNPWEPVVSKISPRIRPLQPGDQEK